MKIEENDLLKDDCNLVYRVLAVMSLCVLVENFPNEGNIAGEVISKKCIDEEGWHVIGKLK